MSLCAQAEEVRRVAYLSTLAEKDASARIGAVARRIDARWPQAQRPGSATIEYRTFRYELPLTAPATTPEAEARRAERNAEIRKKNATQIAAMLAWEPSVIFAPGALPAKAAAEVTSTIPIVFGCKCNPLPDGFNLVATPTRPERNLTGFTRYHLDMVEDDPARRLNLHRKRIELLKQASARPVRRIGAIHGDTYDEMKWRYSVAAQALDVEWVPVRLTDATIDSLPARLAELGIDGGLVLADTFLDKFTRRIVKAAAAASVPVIFPWDEADLGAWMHYGTVVDIPDKAAEYLVNLMNGRAVADYPVEFPKQMELAVNFRTARARGWEFPPQFLLLVDRALE